LDKKSDAKTPVDRDAYGGFGDTPGGMYQYWTKELEASKKELSDFHYKGADVLRAYLDRRDGMYTSSGTSVNLFWSTVQVQLASLYARVPKIDVSRLHKDQDDDVARVASVILERILNCGVEKDGSPFRKAAQEGIKDRLTVGMGQMWYRYEVETAPGVIEAVTDPSTGAELSPRVEYEAIKSEDAPSDYVYWKDFFWSPCRTWAEVRWVARRVYMTKLQAKKRFGEQIGNGLNYAKQTEGKLENGSLIDVQNQAWEKATVFEIWCKETKRVYWYSEGLTVVADWKEDPLEIEGFLPCPEPVAANLTSSRWMPKADYTMAQDLFDEVNTLKTRIKWLVDACRAVGLYDKDAGEIRNMFKGSENTLIPVDNWAAFAEKGGIQGQVSWVPIEQFSAVITQLRVEMNAAEQHIYQVLGISDIMRGASDPDETLGAQQLKAQFGSSRVQFTLSEIADWVASGQRIKASIIAGKFQPDTIKELSNIMATPDAQFADQAIALLKNVKAASWRITIDPDTMAALDWAQERDARTQFLDALGNFLQKSAPLLQAKPEAAPFLMQMLQWAMGGFKVGKEIEGVVDQAVNAMKQPAAPPPPDPKIEVEREKIKSQERIAKMDDDTKRDLESVKAALELYKAGMDQMMEKFNLQMGQVSDAVTAQRDDIRAQKNNEASAQSDMVAAVTKFAEAASKKRKRVPVRDAAGNITEVTEEAI
jgi:hypothetical protein